MYQEFKNDRGSCGEPLEGLGKEWIGRVCSNVEGGLGESKKVPKTKGPVRRPCKGSRDVKAVNTVALGADHCEGWEVEECWRSLCLVQAAGGCAFRPEGLLEEERGPGVR